MVLGLLALAPGVTMAQDDRELTATQEEVKFLDLGNEGVSLGDVLVFWETLKEDDEEVGNSGHECILTQLVDDKTSWFLCFAALRLDDEGQITLQGLVKFEGQTPAEVPFTVAITGGTGDFSSASGEAEIAVFGRPRTYKLKFE